jgi:trans-aconitate 2-methyltransferase
MTDWNPAQYERFKAERQQPFFDLLSLVQPAAHLRVLDLGCGTGELTRLLHDHLQAATTLGVDSSPAMLAKAAAFAAPGLRFVQRDLRLLPSEEEYDLIISNAALHWVPDHAQLLAGCRDALGSAGQLAVQVPANFDHPSHTVAAALAAEAEFHPWFAEGQHPPGILSVEQYALLLERLGFSQQHVRLQVYSHHLPSREAVIEWTKGTLLVFYQNRLPGDVFARFLDRYRERLLPQLDDRQPYFYPFKRILFWARR